jgi:hypothetical protein
MNLDPDTIRTVAAAVIALSGAFFFVAAAVAGLRGGDSAEVTRIAVGGCGQMLMALCVDGIGR